jgi:hypothetical protein
MFWVRWRNLLVIRWLLTHGTLAEHEKKFLRDARDILRNRRKLTPKQRAWLYGMYEREREARKRRASRRR